MGFCLPKEANGLTKRNQRINHKLLISSAVKVILYLRHFLLNFLNLYIKTSTSPIDCQGVILNKNGTFTAVVIDSPQLSKIKEAALSLDVLHFQCEV